MANLTALKQAVQLRLASLRDFAISALWCGDGSGSLANYTLVMYGATWICTARATAPSSEPGVNDAGEMDADGQGDVVMKDAIAPASARAATAKAAKLGWVVRTTAKYQPLLLVAQADVDATEDQAEPPAAKTHLVVIERPYFELAKKLPAAFHRGARYGA